MLSLLLANDHLSEATLTYGKLKGKDNDGNVLTDAMTVGQVAVLRSGPDKYVSRRTWFDGKRFVSRSTILTEAGTMQIKAKAGLVPSVDPTLHPTFQAAAGPDYGRIIATDLHWSQIDENMPEMQRRVEVSVQKSVEDSHAQFVGVLRVGLMKTQIDGSVQPVTIGRESGDPHLIFICDSQGRLITGPGKENHVAVSGDDLRVVASDVSPVIARALQEPVLATIDPTHPQAAASFRMEGKIYLCTFRYLSGTQDWIVGIVVPRDVYLGPLQRMRGEILMALLALIIVIILAGAFIIRSVVRSHSLILKETTRMNDFQFSRMQNTSYLRDVEEVLVGLEKAKTAMRAMSKYVPVKLVRQLYQKGEEPVLGGKSAELSVMFTDIKDFTSISETMEPSELADILGQYLQVMAQTIQSEKGTIDKYIGDAVMTFWNAPEPVAGHEILACDTALRCRQALQKLYDSPAWGNSPRFETRIGLHRCVATVGHFGAPDRLNYTAIGDGINLASRLEGLNKFYGTHIIASESIQAVAKGKFEFRLLDRVAVKGKTEGIEIHELIGKHEKDVPRAEPLERYEQAFALYQRGEFGDALEILEKQPEDAPSVMLVARCREFLSHPPKPWNGIYAFGAK